MMQSGHIDRQIKMIRAVETDAPYVVAFGNECVSSRGDILVFMQLGNAVACQQAMNRIESGQAFGRAGRWEIKRLPIETVRCRYVFFEDLVRNEQLATFRDI